MLLTDPQVYGFRNNSRNNGIKDIMKRIKFLKNRGIFWKGTTTKLLENLWIFLDH